MKTLKELSEITKYNVIGATCHEKVCYYLLIQTDSGYYKSYYVDGQKMGIILKGIGNKAGGKPYKKRPDFKSNVK